MKLLRSKIYLALALATVFLFGPGCTKTARANRSIAQADQYFAAGEYAKAEIEYLNALKTGGINPVAVRQLGIIYSEQGRPLQAAPYLQKASELDPESVDIRRRLGLAYLAVRKLTEATNEANLVLTKEPGNQDALLILVEAAVGSNAVQQTRQRIEELKQRDQDRASYHVALGTLFFRQRDVTNAEPEYKTALAMDPESADAHNALGNLAWIRNDLPQAEAEFKTAADLSPLRSAKRLKLVDFKLKTGGLDDAKKLLEQLTLQVPDYVPAWSMLMAVAFAERRYDDCATLVKQVLALDPINYDASLTSGKLKLLKNDADSALADFQRMTGIYEGVPDLHFQTALAYLIKGDAVKASGSLNRTLALDPDHAEAVMLLAEMNIRQGSAGLAVPALTQLIKRQPQLVRAHLLLASAYLAQKNVDGAVAVYSGMTNRFPKNPEAPALLGGVLLQQGKTEDARAQFVKTLEIAPDFPAAIEQLVYLDLADTNSAAALDRALDRVKKQIAAKPQAAEPWVLLAFVHLARKEPDQAESALEKAIELDPNQRNAYVMLAQLYVAQKKQDQALQKLGDLVARRTNDVAGWTRLGALHESLKNYRQASDAYLKVLALNPKATAVLNNLAYLYSEHLNEIDKAYELADAARKLAPNNVAVADTFGWILFKKGEYTKALAPLQEAAGSSRLESNAEVQFHLGMTHYMLGDERSAKTALSKAVEVTNDFPWKVQARQSLATLSIDPRTISGDALKELEKRQAEQPADPVLCSRLADMYERNGQAAAAAKLYEGLLKRNPANSAATTKLAQLYALADPARAFDFLKEAHRVAPDNPDITYKLGRAVQQKNDPKWAASLFEESARQLPDNPEVMYDLALSYHDLGRLPEAESKIKSALQASSFTRASEARLLLIMMAGYQEPSADSVVQAGNILKTNVDYIPALMVSAVDLHRKRDAAGAIPLYEKILARNSLFTPAIRDLAILYQEKGGDDQKAYALATKAREYFPSDPLVSRALGILSYRRGDSKRAVQLLSESEAHRADDAELQYYLGMATLRSKGPDSEKRAKQALQRALTLNLPGQLAEEARRAIAEIK
jgi:tetratricopeptide (TPR) repeat protein